MSPPNKFTKAETAKIFAVGRKIRDAREAMGLTVRGAADRTAYDSKAGTMSDQTWGRAENGYIPTTGPDGKPFHKIQKPTARTLMAIAEVVGLDGAQLCRELGLRPPAQRRVRPAPRPATIEPRLEEIVEELVERRLAETLAAIERGAALERQSALPARPQGRGRRRASG